jgi:hypothetical protein
MTFFPPHLSRVRTVLFCGLTAVWVSEMTFLGVPALSKVWSYLWQVPVPQDPQLAAALSAAWAVGAPEKGALGVMAILALRSQNAFVRTALFVGMALVPPLNIAFPFREQGFLFGPMAVATTLSTILWGGFFLFREPDGQAAELRAAVSSPSRWETLQSAWFVFYSTVLTLLALLFLFWPRTAFDLALPCASSLLRTDGRELPGLLNPTLGAGTHLLAVAIAFWIGTVKRLRSPTLQRALTLAGTAHAGLFLVFPLPQIVRAYGLECATSSILIAFVPLFVAWVLFAAFSLRTVGPRTQTPQGSPL